MKRVSILLLILFTKNISYSQQDPNDNVFTIQKPIWSHVAIDTTAIGYKGRTGMDFFFFNVESKILYDKADKNVAYLLYNNSIDRFSGTFLEKIDLRNGKSQWTNFFDLRNNDEREASNHYFINDDNELEVLGMKNVLDTFFPAWYNGKFTSRKYDLQTGELKYYWSAPKLDSSYPLLYHDALLTRIIKNKENKYDFYEIYFGNNGYKRNKTSLSELGQFIHYDSAITEAKFQYGYSQSFVLYLPEDNNMEFFQMKHTFEPYPFVTGDSISLVIERFNDKLENLSSFDISDQVSKVRQYSMGVLHNNNYVILSEDLDTILNNFRQRIISVNSLGNIVEEVVFQDSKDDPFGQISDVIKLKNEPGMLMLLRTNSAAAPNKDRFYFYKTDGKGNFKLLKEILLAPGYLTAFGIINELDNGDILWSSNFHKRNAQPSTSLDRYITSRWSASDLGLSATIDKKFENLLLFPNPVLDVLNIEHSVIPMARIVLYDLEGKTYFDQKINHTNYATVTVKDLVTGIYLVQIYGEEGQLIFAGKITKK
ncbi:MAG: T9SS type A sorting domain-containing protein [Saprospiraceae bacterium]